MIIFIAGRDFSKNRFCIHFWTSSKNSDFGNFFPHAAQKCVLRLRATIVKKSDFFAKTIFVQFFWKPSENVLNFLVKCANWG